jgi:xylulokinase
MRDDGRCLIGIDVGTTSVKAVATDLAGERLAGTRRGTPIELGREGRAEHPAELLREAVFATLAELTVELGGRRPAALAVTSMGEAGTFVDAAGEVVRPPIAWSDPRPRPQIERLERELGREEIYRITGHVPDPSFAIGRCMWIREHEPDAFERSRTWLSISDLVVMWLSGARVTDPSIASRTMALDQASGDWSPLVLAAARIDRALMPEVRPSGAIAGELTAVAAKAVGVAAGTPVVLGGHDRLCGAFAARAGEDIAIDSAGTAESLVVSVPLAERPSDGAEAAQIACYRDVVPGRIAYSARVGIAGGLLEWLRRNCFETDGEAPPDFTAMMAELPPLERPPEIVCLPSFGRSIAPTAGEGSMRGTFVGLAEHHRRGDLLRACLEAPAFSLRANVEALERIGGRPLSLRAEGGVVRNPVWMQIRADVLGREFESVEIADLAAIGAALLAGVGVGVFADHQEAGSALSPPRRAWVPRPERTRAYDAVYEGVFSPLAEAVGPLSRKLLEAGG